MIWYLSLNPLFPLITRFYRFVIPVVEVGFFMFIIVYSFFWKNYLPTFQSGDFDFFIVNVIFFTLQWCLLAFPFTSMILGIAIMIVFGLPLLIIDIIRFRK